MLHEYLDATILGLVEGLTEFLPVSSTGHLILFDDLLGFDGPPGKVFEVVVQLGAILAICVVYFQRLWNVAAGLKDDPRSWRFTIAVLLAFLPSAVLGLLLHGFIKAVLFNTTVVCVSLIVGGIAILMIERFLPTPRYHEVERFTAPVALKIGMFQCMALVPGVSRSGSTLTAGLFLGFDRVAAARYSFLLSVPAVVLSGLFELRHVGEGNGAAAVPTLIATVAAFVVGYASIAFLLRYLVRHTMLVFVVYRVVLGAVVIALVAGGAIS